ncbi:hypothetical protein [Butyrivibrio proteoclasticus]|uniref:hypothetical protein n=1 Tax=Butyrivibrio proteoclasticus TaxID=43305 RepID=UPI000684D9D7|nr:hypothetical protein [Butyrivibrio proteoclasticus]
MKRLKALLVMGLSLSMTLTACGNVNPSEETESVTEIEEEDTEEVTKDSENEDEEDEEESEEDAEESDEDEEQADSQEDVEVKETVYEVSDDVKERLEALDSDYNKVNWDYVTTPFDDEDIVISTVVAKHDTVYTVFVGITNLHDEQYDIEAEGLLKDISGDKIEDEEVYLYDYSIGSGNTIIKMINTQEPTDGEIEWDDDDIHDAYRDEFCPFTIDWTMPENTEDFDGELIDVEVSLEEAIYSFDIQCLVLDENGKVIGYGVQEISDNEEEVYSDQIKLNALLDLDVQREMEDIAMFSNPTVVD